MEHFETGSVGIKLILTLIQESFWETFDYGITGVDQRLG